MNGFENVELKASLRSIERAREVAVELAERPVQHLMQTDTYFDCRRGRLKLREIEERDSAVTASSTRHEVQLIWYDRPDRADAKACNFHLVRLSDATEAKAGLAAAWGVRSVVRKKREVYWYRNVRIHLDEVDGLGAFLELEAVLRSPEADAPLATRRATTEDAHRLLAELRQRFALDPSDILAASYGEMILERATSQPPVDSG